MADTYNGWTNWETWQINLWLDNEEPLYREKVRFLRAATHFDAPYVRAFVEGVFPDGTPDMQGDEKESVAEQMGKVNWAEIAAHFAEEAKEYAELEHR